MILRGLVLLCPFSPFPLPPSLFILLYSLVLTVEGRVVSYGVWDCCAPSLCLSSWQLRGECDLTGYGTVVPPYSPLILPYPIV